MPQNPLIVALDTDDRARLAGWAEDLGPVVGLLKVGLQAHTALGPAVVADVAAHAPVFLDLKLHDIPNTVAGAAAAAADAGIAMLTVHASGGPAMVAAAAEAAPDVAILAVTVLTSLDDGGLAAVGQPPADEQVPRLARMAVEAGATGIVCAAAEVTAVRAAVGADPLVVVPGIRPARPGAQPDDQARTATPRAALDAGASHLVVGRPVTTAADPVVAARAILREVGGTADVE
ncbi:orotidine-5'-phosphate decarboxylase [Euzebya sp.]|uniref:orotidine-5'-phosphate decarboxylase n=1 Tax=Euzebya sp. TaxID=1971409 RepID=UPI003513D9A7